MNNTTGCSCPNCIASARVLELDKIMANAKANGETVPVEILDEMEKAANIALGRHT